jgi:hypothetical protein
MQTRLSAGPRTATPAELLASFSPTNARTSNAAAEAFLSALSASQSLNVPTLTQVDDSPEGLAGTVFTFEWSIVPATSTGAVKAVGAQPKEIVVARGSANFEHGEPKDWPVEFVYASVDVVERALALFSAGVMRDGHAGFTL